MVAQQLGLHKQSTDDHKFQDPYEEEEEETLSFCDLLLTSSSNSSCDENSNKDDQNFTFGDEGFFEFFSEDFTASTYPAADKIIFCGKVIGSKEEEEEEKETTIMDRKAQSQEFTTAKIKGGLSHKLRTTSSRHQARSTGYKTLSSQGSVNKVSIISSPLVNSKWCGLAFGMGRYSMEMEQRDIKMRQSRRAPAMMFPTVKKYENEMIEGNGRRSGKGLWGLLGLLGCKKNQKTKSDGILLPSALH